MIFDKRKIRQKARREDKLNYREAHKQQRLEKREARKQRMLMKKYGEGGIVYPIRFKYNRRILLLTRLRRK